MFAPHLLQQPFLDSLLSSFPVDESKSDVGICSCLRVDCSLCSLNSLIAGMEHVLLSWCFVFSFCSFLSMSLASSLFGWGGGLFEREGKKENVMGLY